MTTETEDRLEVIKASVEFSRCKKATDHPTPWWVEQIADPLIKEVEKLRGQLKAYKILDRLKMTEQNGGGE